jgi:hypothetical protein
LKQEFSDSDKGEFGRALLKLPDEKMVTTNKKKQLEVPDKAKKAYHL